MEKQVLTIIFVLLTIVILLNSGIDKAWQQYSSKKTQLKEQREQILGKKTRRMEIFVTSEKELVRTTNTDMRTYLLLLIASIAGGWAFGKLVFMDTTISLFIAGICIIIPHAFLVLKGNRDTRERAENLESAMRIITHEYISTLDIQRAVENSIDVLEHDKPFREFLVDCKVVSSNVERNLRRLESKERNTYFSRWIDQLILVQTDRNQIVNLMPIIDDMNDAKTAQRQNDTQVAGAWRDYFTLLFIILLSPLLIRLIQYEWYMYLITTFVGRVLVILMLACLVWATIRAMKINKPITG